MSLFLVSICQATQWYCKMKPRTFWSCNFHSDFCTEVSSKSKNNGNTWAYFNKQFPMFIIIPTILFIFFLLH